MPLSVTTPLVRRLALASLGANVTIVLTGGLVRLTDSGLGCPTWPACTDESYTATAEMGLHGAIEFGNRMLGGVVGVVAIAALVAAVRWRPRRPAVVRLAALVLAGVLAQGLLGGITVRTGLNPWTVAAHFALSMAVIAAAYAQWRRIVETTGPPPAGRVPAAPLRHLVRAIVAASALVLALGTVVTGSGPHAGDPDTARLGFAPETVAQLHTDAVFLLLGLTAAGWLALRAAGAPPIAVRAAFVLLAVELGQGVIGVVQYALHLPELAVWLHMAGSCVVWLAALHLWDATRRPAPPRPPAPAADREAVPRVRSVPV